jgi:hypothetical protein
VSLYPQGSQVCIYIYIYKYIYSLYRYIHICTYTIFHTHIYIYIYVYIGIGAVALVGGNVPALAAYIGGISIVGPVAKLAVGFPLVYHYLGKYVCMYTLKYIFVCLCVYIHIYICICIYRSC